MMNNQMMFIDKLSKSKVLFFILQQFTSIVNINCNVTRKKYLINVGNSKNSPYSKNM